MKTKNIFRMLLVAAALLMGANNVKAAYEYKKETFANLTSSSTIRVNCSNINDNYWQITFATLNDETPDFDDWKGGTDWGSAWYYTKSNHANYLINNSYFDLKCNQNTVNKLKKNGLKIDVQGLTVTSVTIDDVSGGGQGGQQGGDQTNDYITINAISHGYRTYVTTQAINFGGSQNIEGYYASEVSGNNVVFTKVTGVCASDVPLLLVKTGSGDCKLLKSSDTGTEPPTNFLHPGETVNGKGKVVNDSRQYVLTWHNNAPVFAETNVNAARVDAEHAYLVLPSNASGRLRISFKHDDDDLTGIQSLQSDERSLDRAVYNLRGQRVEHPTKGIYIINGKKVIIK